MKTTSERFGFINTAIKNTQVVGESKKGASPGASRQKQSQNAESRIVKETTIKTIKKEETISVKKSEGTVKKAALESPVKEKVAQPSAKMDMSPAKPTVPGAEPRRTQPQVGYNDDLINDLLGFNKSKVTRQPRNGQSAPKL